MSLSLSVSDCTETHFVTVTPQELPAATSSAECTTETLVTVWTSQHVVKHTTVVPAENPAPTSASAPASSASVGTVSLGPAATQPQANSTVVSPAQTDMPQQVNGANQFVVGSSIIGLSAAIALLI